MKSDVFLLDSGVWVASLDGSDSFVLPSKELVADTRRTFGALDLTLYEVANTVGSKWGRCKDAVDVCLQVEERCWLTMVRIDALLIEATVEIAGEHGLTSYDAAYVAVAQRHDWTLVSTDIRDLVSRGLAITPDAAV